MEKSRLTYLAPEIIIFNFVSRERLSTLSEASDDQDPWFPGIPDNTGGVITSDRIEIPPSISFGPED